MLVGRMLAKEMKIQNLTKQESFIRERLAKAAKNSQNGSVSFLYIGFIYKEVRAELETDGFCFKEIGTNSSGIPMVLLYLSDCDLTQDELADAEIFYVNNPKTKDESDKNQCSSTLEPIDYMH